MMNLKTRRKIFGTLSGLILFCALVLWIAAAWTDDPLQTRLAVTGSLLLIPALASALACVDWDIF